MGHKKIKPFNPKIEVLITLWPTPKKNSYFKSLKRKRKRKTQFSLSIILLKPSFSQKEIQHQ